MESHSFELIVFYGPYIIIQSRKDMRVRLLISGCITKNERPRNFWITDFLREGSPTRGGAIEWPAISSLRQEILYLAGHSCRLIWNCCTDVMD